MSDAYLRATRETETWPTRCCVGGDLREKGRERERIGENGRERERMGDGAKVAVTTRK